MFNFVSSAAEQSRRTTCAIVLACTWAIMRNAHHRVFPLIQTKYPLLRPPGLVATAQNINVTQCPNLNVPTASIYSNSQCKNVTS